MLEVLLGYDHRVKNSYLTMGLYSKDTETKMDLLAVPSVNSCLKARTQYIKESSTSVWSIALQSRTFGLSFFKWSPLKNSTSLTEK